jgi:hypothetical protein
MLADDILTLVVKEKNPLHNCVNASRINRQMTVDRTKVLRLRELSQKLHDTSYITSLDFFKYHLRNRLENGQRSSTKTESTNLKLFRTVSRTFYQHLLRLQKRN